MIQFGKFLDRSLQDLAYEPIWNAIRESNIDPHDIAIAFVGNAYAGLITGQESMRGQVLLREAGIAGMPIVNVENACASGSTAFYLAHKAVASGQVELALAVGVEKLFCDDRARSLEALSTSCDLDIEGRMGVLFAGIYSMRIRAHMEKYGLTREHLAKVAVKNHDHGALNPYAQYRNRVTVDEVLTSRMIADPITLLMTCPLGDGGAALLVGTKELALKMGKRPIKIGASLLGSFGFTRKDDFPPRRYREEPVKSGIYAGHKCDEEKWNEMLDKFYDLQGWDKETSWQTRRCLMELDLGDVADKLEKAGKLK